MESSKWETFFQKINAFGSPYKITFDFKFKFDSSKGELLTIFVFFLIITVFFLLSSEIFIKANPNNISKLHSEKIRPNLTFDLSNAFLVEDQYGNIIPNFDKYLNIREPKIGAHMGSKIF